MRIYFRCTLMACCLAAVIGRAKADVPFEGFLPFVGMALTNEFEDSTSPNASPTFFIAQPSNQPGGQFLGPGSSAYFDIALLDTGAATHILTPEATTGFNIFGEGFDGTNFQTIGGATGLINLRINDPLGVYVAGMAERTGSSPGLAMNSSAMRGQTSFSLLSAPAEWTLPNIVGLPMAAQHEIQIRNSEPQIFQLDGRTVRTPQIDLEDLGTNNHGILRRAPLRLEPGISFIQGPLYIQNFDIFTLNFHENPLSPTVVDSGGLYVETDIADGSHSINDKRLLFDTGASLTVVSEQTAVRLGFDPILDTPEFVVSVEGSGGVSAGIPGFFADQLRLDTVGGTFVLQDVPIAVLDVTDPSNPGNVIDGILGMNLFAERDIVIDANPSVGQGGVGPSLYISDPVTEAHVWGTTAASGNWSTASNWSAAGTPSSLWNATVANTRGSQQEAVVSSATTVFRTTISGPIPASMIVRVAAGGTLTSFADVRVDAGGELRMDGGKVDAQYVQIDGGRLTGHGEIFVGSGPISGTVRIDAGAIAPGIDSGDVTGALEIVGDLSIGFEAKVVMDIAGTVAGVSYDQINSDRFAFLSGELQVQLATGFAPQVGSVFTLITATDGVQGEFDTMSLPSGFTWSVDYLPTLVRLEVTGIGLVGDFDGNGVLDCSDIDMLTQAAASGVGGVFDLTGDGVTNSDDVTEWVVNLKGTSLGDANLDGSVDGSDFSAWNGHKYSDLAAYCSGDFNGDGSVDGSDFSVWNVNKFRNASALVPEPATAGWCLLLLLLCGRSWLRREAQ